MDRMSARFVGKRISGKMSNETHVSVPTFELKN